jgi:hypothetical protein
LVYLYSTIEGLLLVSSPFLAEFQVGRCGLVFQAEYELFSAGRLPFYLKVPQPDVDGDEFAREYDHSVFKYAI